YARAFPSEASDRLRWNGPGILDALREGPLTTGAIAELFPELSRYAVMQHLGVLAEAELVLARREERERDNYLNPVPIQRIHDRWVSRYMQPWTEALVSMREQLETEERKRAA